MTPDLIAALLRESLPVRLALLDADPTGAGWYVFPVTGGHHATLQQFASDAMPGSIKAGAAWLPCNPLAIVDHAARLRFGSTGWCASIVSIDGTQGEYHATVERHNESLSRKASGSCPHTAAIALLREVVGG